MFGLNFYISEWHGQAIFLHLPKDTCATAICVLSRLCVLLFHSCALKCFKPKSSLSTVLFTARTVRNGMQTVCSLQPAFQSSLQHSEVWIRPGLRPAEVHSDFKSLQYY